MTCNNLGDERLEAALEVPTTSDTDLLADVLAQAISDLSNDVVGDIGEKAFELILGAQQHEIIQQSDKHTARPNHQLPNDMVTISPNGELLVHDVKSTAVGKHAGKHAARPNPDGTQNLIKPSLSKDTHGVKQLADRYNLPRMEQAIFFETGFKEGEGPQSVVTKIDLKAMEYQSWLVDATGRTGASIHPCAQSAGPEIAAALAMVMEERGVPWPP